MTLHMQRVIDYNPLQRDILDGSARRDYKKIFEIIVNSVNKATSLYHTKWQEHQENALKINLVLLKFNVRFSSHNRLICSDPKLVMGLLGTGFKEHMFSGVKHLSQKHFSASEYLKSLDDDLKFVETNSNSASNMGRTSSCYFIRFLADPVVNLFNLSDYGYRKSSQNIDDKAIKKFLRSWVRFDQMPNNHHSENPFISTSGGWMSSVQAHDRGKWDHLIKKLQEWESTLSENMATGWQEGSLLEMYNGGPKKILKAIPQQVSPEEMLLPTYDRNLNNILLKFKDLIVSSAPQTQGKINNDPLLYNFFTALESEVNKENLRAKLDTVNNVNYKQNADADYYLYTYSSYFLTIIQQAIDQYHHHTANQKDKWDFKFGRTGEELEFKAANLLDPFITEGRINFWGEATLANSKHYRDGWHGKTGRVRAIYYSLFIMQIEVIIKTTRVLRDKLAAQFKASIYLNCIYHIIDCLHHSFRNLQHTSVFGGERGEFSFYTLLRKSTYDFAQALNKTLVNDIAYSYDKRGRELECHTVIINYWNEKLSQVAKLE